MVLDREFFKCLLDFCVTGIFLEPHHFVVVRGLVLFLLGLFLLTLLLLALGKCQLTEHNEQQNGEKYFS